MSNDIMGYDTNTREAIYENEFADRYEDLLNEIYPELVIGYSTFEPGEVMREMSPLDFRMGMLDYWDDLTKDGEVVDNEDELPYEGPVCEECDDEVTEDEATLSLGRTDDILCAACLNGREDDAET